MKVLVVGARGVVGRHLVPQLLADGHDVVATFCSESAAQQSRDGSVWRQLNLLDEAATHRLVEREGPEVIIHQATALSRLGNNLRRFDASFAVTNRLRTTGTAALLSAAQACGRPRVIVQGFCGWPWAPTGSAVKVETDPLDPNPPAGFRRTFASLVAMERLVAGYENGVVLRYGALYGPGTSLGHGGAQIEAIRRRRLPLVGEGSGVWSFLHTADAASATVAAVHAGRGVYNVVDDDPATVAEWLPELARLLHAPTPRQVPVWLAGLLGGEGAMRLMTMVRGSSNAKARTELGWSLQWPSWRDGFAVELGVSSAAARKGSP